MRRVALALILSSCLTGVASAQLVPALNSKPEAYAKLARVPEARDIPFPGTLQLTVDATGRVTGAGNLGASDVPALDAAKITTGQLAW